MVMPPVEVAAHSTPCLSTATAPMVPPAYSGCACRKLRNLRVRSFLQPHPEYAGGTIGAGAVDRHGRKLRTLKLRSFLQAHPEYACGTYADKLAASSATGTGEFVIRAMSCRQISDNVAKGMTIQQAVDAALDYLGREFDADVGLIAIDAKGAPYGNHRTADMPHAWFSGTGEIIAKMRVAR